MFIGNLNKDQQGVLLAIAQKLINVDGQVSVEEVAILEQIKLQCDNDVEAISYTEESMITLFPDRRSKVSLLLEILGVAYSDTEYCNKEQDFLTSLASNLSINDKELQKLTNWVTRQLNLVQEVALLMEE
ncbi:TPA: TerB family tellurite resistance protein [Vibrio vulnificus]